MSTERKQTTDRTPEPREASTADARALHRSLEDLIRLIQFRDRDRICCHGISVSQCYTLEALVMAGPLRLNALAGRLYLEKSTASRVVDGLVAKGYAERTRDPEDGRAVLVAATAQGRTLYERIEEDLVAEVRAVVADFDPEVRQGMVLVLDRLVRAAASRVEVEAGCCRLRPAS